MTFENMYDNAKKAFLKDAGICEENRILFKAFFDKQENKLKRRNRISSLDEPCYKTLYGYIGRLKNVNTWFDNKPWVSLTKEDITNVYNDLEDGKIKTKAGNEFKDKEQYYAKVFKSTPFELAGKDDLAREVIDEIKKLPEEDDEVRYIKEDTFRKLVDVAIDIKHKLLLWLQFDVGENIGTALKLQKKDFTQQINEVSKEKEYLVNLPRFKLKRSRKKRGETTNLRETAMFLEIALKDLKDDDLVFDFKMRQAQKVLDRAVRLINAKCIPNGEKVTWKDLRSSMACYLLSKGWHTDEINRRLGHSPSSRQIDKYVSFLDTGNKITKKVLYESDMKTMQDELKQLLDARKLDSQRIETLQRESDTVYLAMEKLRNEMRDTIAIAKKNLELLQKK